MRRLAVVLALFLPLSALAAESARPWIGVLVGKGSQGVLIKEVLEQTPAAKAGVKAGDEVLTIDGKAVKEQAELISAVQQKGVGEKVTLKLLRDKKQLDVTMALEARPDELKMLRDALVGKPAPAFEVTESIGIYPASLSKLKGNVVVLEFWATWCGPCKASLPRLDEWQKKYDAKGLRVIGISDEERPQVAKFVADKKIQHTVACDGKVNEAYKVPAIPMLVVIDRGGVVRYVDIGAGSKLDAVESAFVPLLDKK